MAVKTFDEQADWVMSFVQHSDDARQDLETIWDEAEDNYLVRPYNSEAPNTTSAPLGNIGWSGSHRLPNGMAVLKDPETHQIVSTLVANIILTTLGEPGFAKAKRRGFEDIGRAKVASKLIEYVYSLPDHFFSFFEWILSAGIYGTGLVEAFWDFQEEPRRFRTISVNEFGEEVSEFEVLEVPTYDDVRFECFDVRDFFPDPGNHILRRMKGCARRFRIPAGEVKRRAEAGFYRTRAVNRAMNQRSSDDVDDPHKSEDQSDLKVKQDRHPDFEDQIAYRYVGEVPFKTKDGFQRREIHVINGQTVRSRAWPRAIPFFDFKFKPRLGSFWGIGAAEIARYDQDFADVLKMMLADAVVRVVHPPPVYDRTRAVDLAKLRRWNPRVPIGVDGDPNSAIATARYDPQLQAAFALQGGLKQQMREGTGALDANQGLPLGTKRLSASEAVGVFERAAAQPEMHNTLLERVALPPLAKYTIELYREFLEDSEDLLDRIGESNATAVLADIMPDFDVEFVGSRQENNRSQQLQAFREIMAASANPVVAQLIPWVPLLQKHFDQLGAHEIAAMVGNPQMVQQHLLLHMLTGQTGQNAISGNQNGTQRQAAPSGLLPAQTLGGPAA